MHLHKIKGLALILAILSINTIKAQFQVKVADLDHGSIKVEPAIPADGVVAADTKLTLKAIPESGHEIDAIYYTVQGGMWGTTSYEFFSPEETITVTKDMTIGATFVERSLVNNLNIYRDIVYAKPGKKELKYDVFAPKGGKDLPMVVIIHGGGWSSNNEDIMRALAWELAKENTYVVASIDYRWINSLDGDKTPNSMHHLVEDVFGAITHLQENASKYGANPNQIAVTGDSAGGHLSAAAATLSDQIGTGDYLIDFKLMPTYLPEGKTAEQVGLEIRNAIKAAAPSYGVFDVNPLNQFISQTDIAYRNGLSPINNVPSSDSRKVQHFLTRGTKDGLISHEMVQAYVDALEAKGQKAIYLQVEDAGHAFFDWKPDSTTRATFDKYGVPYAAKMRAFFDEVFY